MIEGYYTRYKCDHCPPDRPKFAWLPEAKGGLPAHWSARKNSSGDEEHICEECFRGVPLLEQKEWQPQPFFRIVDE